MIANKIHDEFACLPISRQRKYQLRKKRDGRCTECGEPVLKGSRCLKHLVASRERQREKRGLKKRYFNTLSYKLEMLAAKPSMPADPLVMPATLMTTSDLVAASPAVAA
jgi:hypothetical protein